jgi:hypothetical protein|tara:strand:+ start:181 stop:663 length:483 start_codon:yes stop_codon:yes gene_type:complete
MMKVLFLHGLESKPTGPKMRYLKDRFESYYAPEIDYEEPEAYEEILDLCIDEEFDVIIGSSMGGYFAHAIGTTLGTPVIMFNPALHSRGFDPYGVVSGEKPLDGVCVLGMEDRVIDPHVTVKMLENEPKLAIMPMEGMGHRTPFTEFITAIETIVPEEIE